MSSNHVLGTPFAIGHTAEVYSWEDGTILKLFHERVRISDIRHEARVARAVHQAGLPTPAVLGDMVEIAGRKGLVYERVPGVSMLESLTSQPWKAFRYAHDLATLHAEVHSRHGVPELPEQREQLRNKIQSADMLAPQALDVVLTILEELPTGNQLCHGDFHPDNLLLTENGPVIIDWIDGTIGNSLADVARSSLLMSMGEIPADKRMRWFLSRFSDLFRRTYLKRYFQIRPGDKTEFESWLIVNAAARLSEDVPEEQMLVSFVEDAIGPKTVSRFGKSHWSR